MSPNNICYSQWPALSDLHEVLQRMAYNSGASNDFEFIYSTYALFGELHKITLKCRLVEQNFYNLYQGRRFRILTIVGYNL